MNLDIPKQYLCINGREVLSYSIGIFKQIDDMDVILVVTDSDVHSKYVQDRYGVEVVVGGPTRNVSFYNALQYIKKNHPDCDKVVVNEAARPLITQQIVNDYIELLDEYDVVYSVKDITDSLETIDGDYVDRTKFRLIMSPEGYNFNVIFNFFNKGSETTFPGHCVPSNYKKIGYIKYRNNFKLTYMEDLCLISKLLLESSGGHNPISI